MISFSLLYITPSEAHPYHLKKVSPSIYVNEKVWLQVKDYLIPDEHPVKEQLDLIFSNARVLSERESLEAAGFTASLPQHRTQMIVAKHLLLQGYIIKAYFDDQPYYEDKPEHYYWIKRIKGANLIRHYINTHRYDHLFKVPKKWIYLLPDHPSPPEQYLRKMFILVEEDMQLFDDPTNEQLWSSEWVTKERLFSLYKILKDLGLLDSAKPSNCSFSIDGKAAFVDTELYHRRIVKYEKLTPYLSPSMREYWEKITQHKNMK